jgi:hypothetical protein
MPGLIRGVARTAVVAGTATAVSNRVSRRQAQRWSAQAEREEPIPEAASPSSPPEADPVGRLTELVALRDRGVLTDEEFAAAKRTLLQP